MATNGRGFPFALECLIKTEQKEQLKVVAVHLEDSLKVFEAILEGDDVAALYPASRGLLSALKELYTVDSGLLTPESRARVENSNNQEQKKRSGRDSFNTGF